MPSGIDIVCVIDGSPVLGHAPTGHAHQLYMRGGSLTVEGELDIHGKADLGLTVLRGPGRIVAIYPDAESSLAGVKLTDGLTVGLSAVVVGSRDMCGGTYSLCLTTGARFVGKRLFVDQGTTVWSDGSSATPISVSEVGETSTGAGSGPAEIAARLSAADEIIGYGESVLRIDDLVQLSADGTLGDGSPLFVYPAGGAIVLPRPIVTNRAQLWDVYDKDLTVPSGGSALASLTRNEGTIVGNSLTIDGSLTNTVHGLISAPWNSSLLSVAGDLRNYGEFDAPGPVTVAGELMTAGVLSVGGGPVNVGSLTQVGGSITVYDALIKVGQSGTGPVQLNGGTFALPGGSTIEGTVVQRATLRAYICGSHVDGSYTGAGPSAMWEMGMSADLTDVHCSARVEATGPVTLPRTLALNVNSHVPAPVLGDRYILLNAPAGITNQFARITGSPYGANHFEISYTATQVIATLVAGPPPAGGVYV